MLGIAAGGCDSGAAPTDAATPDPDGAVQDAGFGDAGLRDAGLQDAGLHDAGLQDAARPDSGHADGGASDAAAADAGGVDAGSSSDAAAGTDAGLRLNCIDAPHECGYPDATNTGVPPGVSLTRSGTVRVTTDGAVVENLDIVDGQIVVRANDVTIRNVRITGCQYYPIDYGSGFRGLVIQDSEIASTCSLATAGVSFENFTALRVNVHGSADGFKANRNAIIRDCYIHDLAVSPGSHNDGVQSTGGDDVVFEHNTCDTGMAGVCIQFGGSNRGWQVNDNLVRATGWAFNGSAETRDSTFTNNRFAPVPGWYGPASLPGTGIVWRGNYYDDTGLPVP